MRSISQQARPIRTIVSFGSSPREGCAGTIRPLLHGLLNRLLLWQQRASERTRLERLSDHDLRDVGLSRADIEEELSKPFRRR